MIRLGAEHNAALLATLVACAFGVWLGRKLRGSPTAVRVGRTWALFLAAAQIADLFISAHYGWLDARYALPLELCDISGFAIMIALWTRRQMVFELAYYWGLSGALLAILMPDMPADIPTIELVRFFFIHIGIVAAVFYLGPGLGMEPRPRSEWKVFGITLGCGAVVGVVNQWLGSNYMYVCTAPPGTPLEWFGPWPWYLLGAAGICIGMYLLLALPYRFSRSRSS